MTQIRSDQIRFINRGSLVGNFPTGTAIITGTNNYPGNEIPFSVFVQQDVLNDQKDPTGWLDPTKITGSYTINSGTVTLHGNLTYYWRGVKTTLTSPWISPAHPRTAGEYFLYTNDGVNFTWSTNAWAFDYLMVAKAINYTGSNTYQFALNEPHGMMPWQAHQEFHDVISSYRVSGGQLVSGTYAENTATDAANTPSFASAVLADEDLQTTIPAWNQGTYTTMHIGPSSSVVFDTASSLPFRASGTYALINNVSTGALSPTTTGKYFNVYQILVPVMFDTNSQKYRMIMLQPQVAYNSLAEAQAEDVRTLSFGNLSSSLPEFVLYARITYVTSAADVNTGKCRIATNGITYVVGSKLSQVITSGFTPTAHNSLSGLQGGSASEYYHLSSGTYTKTVNAREVLQSARTYYVATAGGGGSDSNDGLSASTPFLTIQKAVDTVSALDIAGQTVTIQVANGTYTGAVSLKDVPGAIVANPPTLKGDTSTPGNVIISTTSANAVTNNSKNTLWFVQGFKLVTTTSGYALVGSNYSWTNFQNIEFGSCAGYQVYAGPNALVVGGSNYTISGGAVAHWWCEMGEIRVIGRVITLTGTPAFSAYFAYSAYTGRIVDPSTTFSGSATGVRYKVEENGVIYTGSGQAFPGSLPGVRATGGVYDSVYGTQRDTLSSARTYYVSNSGSDTNNDGLSAGSPFATIQKAWDVVSALDLSTYEVSISIADGNYTSGLVVTNGPIGYGQVTITGNVTNPSNVVVSTTNVNAFFINNPCKIKIEGVKITTTGVSTSGIAVYNAGAYVTIGKVEFGTTTTAHIYATAGKILCVTNYTITGASAYHILASLPANIEYANVAVTLSGTLAFTVFCKLDGCASGSFYGGSFTGGTITGKRWEANFNGVINVWGAGANYFPGNAAGSSLDGSGVYG